MTTPTLDRVDRMLVYANEIDRIDREIRAGLGIETPAFFAYDAYGPFLWETE